jgi:hypothetical protein
MAGRFWRKPKGQCSRLEAVSELPATSAAGGRFTQGSCTMDRPYSAFADLLNKIHTSSDVIQAL